jgi:hypothetical protein
VLGLPLTSGTDKVPDILHRCLSVTCGQVLGLPLASELWVFGTTEVRTDVCAVDSCGGFVFFAMLRPTGIFCDLPELAF